MAEGVPTNALIDAIRSCDRQDVPFHEVVRPVWLSPLHGLAGKDVIVVHRVGALPSSAPQIVSHIAVERNQLSGCLRFAIADNLMPDGTGHLNFKIVEIQIPPTECEEFAHAKPGACIEQSQGPFPDGQFAESSS